MAGELRPYLVNYTEDEGRDGGMVKVRNCIVREAATFLIRQMTPRHGEHGRVQTKTSSR